MAKNQKLGSWNFLHALFWGYSTLLSFIFVLLMLVPNSASAQTSSIDWVAGVLLFGPVFGFLFSMIVERKQYSWNWWKIILQAYSITIAFLLVLGSFVTGTAASSSGLSILSSLMFCPLLIYFVIRGNERFEY